ncbi:hybrid sensor histidine kinase/response regulator, partial [Chamaesiphon sp. OTE_75_metabat_556]|uniref:hybrid sensor histidine kinase/response regulator n=1 Tax=Chamaesiphon sp. OTE_75_metabat_556 TaxID=2964692 RepID=UPI00286C087A
MYIDDEELRGLYKTSAAEHIQAIESALMLLEKQPQNPAVLKDLLRSAHTLKGDSRMLGVEDVETLVHQIEECLMPILQGRGSANEKGQASMTEALCDRLYTGLDTIKQLAHTAVTGEPNDVNMFYVLATLMGDGGAAPLPNIGNSGSVGVQTALFAEIDGESSVPDLDDLPSFGWVSMSDEESLFDTPSELWVHEGDRDLLQQPISAAVEPLPSLDPPEVVAPTPSQLQTSFLELAAELFAPEELTDSALPQVDATTGIQGDREQDFNDFILMPGTVPPPAADLDDLFSLDAIKQSSFDGEGHFTLISSQSGATARSTQADEDSLFGAFDDLDLLVPATDEAIDLALPILADLTTESIESSSAPPARLPDLHPTPPVPPALPAANIGEYQIETIRVEAKQLDALMGQSGEINVINQQIASRLLDLEALVEIWENGSRDYQYFQTLIQQLPSHSPLHHQLSRNNRQWEQMGALIDKFKKSIGSDSSRLEQVTSALESGVKKLRLLPLATIFNLYPRMVRDLAKTQSKEINLAIDGGDLLLDKRLLEEIKDPLMHILRNAIDHGIETPAERQQNGKVAAATLSIQVRQTGNQTTIEILDDGRGLDVQRIKATAIKRGLHTKAELDAMGVDRIQSLIFAAGFSTRARVTELSGRGVGLDIVKTNIERVKGSVEVESSPDRGCTFRIVLTHAIGSSQVMMVDVRDQTYAIPVEFVDRMLLVNKAEIFALGGTPTTQINGQTTTVAWLADLLSLPATAPNSPGEIARTSNSISCLLLQSGRQQLALLVDRINDRQLVTIESPHPLLHNVPHLSGSTILGTGAVCLVLNPLDLFATAAGHNPLAPSSTDQSLPIDTTPSILLVEDSLVIRTQMTRILTGAGYTVTATKDGLEGWETLQAGQFDLVVSDVEMPRWGGLQLTSEIR